MARPTTRPPKTVQDYLALPEDMRAELIAGELYMTPAPRLDHQRVCVRLAAVLAAHVERTRSGEVFISPVDVHLPNGDVVQPDVVFVAADQARILREDAIHGAPRLLVEVVSPGNAERDRIVKHRLYEKSGVAEYWIVSPEERGVEVFALREGRYEAAGWFSEGATVCSPVLPGLDLPVRRLFGSVRE